MQHPYTIKSGDTVGAAGAAEATSAVGMLGSGSQQVQGAINAIGVDFVGTHPATTNVTVRTKGKHGPAQTILALVNVNTDGWYYPRVQTTETDGSAPALYDKLYVDDEVEVFVAESDPDVSVSITLLVDA